MLHNGGRFRIRSSHYDMSIACGERVLLPNVRDAKAETIVVADGFSCREQIMQTTKRQALHPAEAMRMAMTDRGYHCDDAYPERRFFADPAARSRAIVRRGYVALAGATLLTMLCCGAAVALRGKRP